MNNPLGNALRKIKNFLTHKQTLFATTFSIKVTPIVALVSLLGVVAVFGGGITTAYNFGKSVGQKVLLASLSTSPTPGAPTPVQSVVTNVSKVGTIKATFQNPSTGSGSSIPTPTVIAPSPASGGNEVKQSDTQEIAASPSAPRNDVTNNPTPTPTQAVLHYILVDKSGAINYLKAPATIHLQNYLNLRVLITGSLNSTTNTLTISKSTDIEVLQ